MTELTDAEVLAELEANEQEIATSQAEHEAKNRQLKEMCEIATRKHYAKINQKRKHA